VSSMARSWLDQLHQHDWPLHMLPERNLAEAGPWVQGLRRMQGERAGCEGMRPAAPPSSSPFP